ncbi:MAG: DUF2125 domain-containing protein [Sneathiellales bacterium]|nr:DUF2125 domain-containing protein [Sneathiellales bacterium]
MRIVIAGVVALAAIGGGYSYWWDTVAQKGKQELQAEKERLAARGIEINYDPVEVSGFPYRVKYDLNDFSITQLRDNQEENLNFENLWVVIQPWNFRHAIFGTEKPVRYERLAEDQSRKTVITPEKILGSVTFNNELKLDSLAVDAENLSILANGKQNYQINRLQVHERPFGITETASDNSTKTKDGRQFSVRLNDLSLDKNLSSPLGHDVQKINILAAIEGSWDDLRAKEKIIKWRDAGGIVNIEEFSVQWGESTLTSSGSLSVDNHLKPVGAMTSQILDYEKGLKALTETIGQEGAMMLGMMVLGLSKENEKGEKYLDIPLTFQDGWIFLDTMKLAQLSPVYE